MSIKWTQQEDNLLKQLDALGYSSSKIYKEYGSILKNRSQNAIALRLSYLHKPPEERRKEDIANFDNADMLEKAINQAADRICNRLDNIANALAVICRDMESNAVGDSKHAAHTIKLLEEIKANGTLQQGTQQSIKHELQKVVYRRNMKGIHF